MVEANDPIRQGAPGLMSCVSAIAAIVSANTCASVPATVHGLIAPVRTQGVQATGCPARALTLSAPDICASITSGALVFDTQ